MTDEREDYIAALQEINEAGSISAVQRIATNVLRKHKQDDTMLPIETNDGTNGAK